MNKTIKLIILFLFLFTNLIHAIEYIGSEKCKECHKELFADFEKTGHNHIMHMRENQFYPFSTTELIPPPGYTWDEIAYILGGFAWKAIFVDTNGYIVTGEKAQYNLKTREFVPYFPEEKEKKYNCGFCHTTGYTPKDNMYGLPGFFGTWEEDGIKCERCHGPASSHINNINNKTRKEYKVKNINQMCIECHSSVEENCIYQTSEEIKHKKQYDQLAEGHHSKLDCTACHDPHISSKYNPEKAIKHKCTSCHIDMIINCGMDHLNCQECHMPYSITSATKNDMRAHVFSINTDSTFNSLQNKSLTLDVICLKCHEGKNIGWASRNAKEIHSKPKYVGPEKCAGCHKDIYNNFISSGHNHILNKPINGQSPIFPNSTTLKTPLGYSWDNISYIIGGYSLKANFVDLDGFIITGDKAQYNISTKELEPYNPKKKNKIYNCIRCHTTEYILLDKQYNSLGIVSSWESLNITCERCHGKGSNHINNPKIHKFTINKSIDLCRECHFYYDDKSNNDFDHHIKYNQIIDNHNCVSCHDPHVSARYSSDKAVKDCSLCHNKKLNFGKTGLLKCKDCHMPSTTLSAIQQNKFIKDMRSLHILKISTDSTQTFNINSNIKFLTLDIICLKCHEGKSLGWASKNATLIH